MATPFNDIIQDETAAYLNDHVDPDNPPTSSTIEQELLDKVNDMIEVENVGRPKKNQLPFLKTLTHGQIAMILRHLHNFCRIAPSASNADPDADPLGMYMDEGPEAGIDQLPGGGPDVILVSARAHQIDLIGAARYTDEGFFGLNYMKLELDFQVA